MRSGFCVRVLLVLIGMMVLSCGRKGEPTMRTFVKPAPVIKITAVHRENSILLSWSYSDPKDIVSGFYLEKAGPSLIKDIPGPFKKIAFLPDTARSYTDKDFAAGETCYYRLTVLSIRKILSNPSPDLKVVPEELPPPPSGLSYELTKDAMKISWQKVPDITTMSMYSTLPRPLRRLNMDNESGPVDMIWQSTGVKSETIKVQYDIYKSSSGQVFPPSPLNSAALNVPGYVDAVETGPPSYYVVRSLLDRPLKDEGFPSKALEVDPATFVPSRPAGLNYIHEPVGVVLIWNDNPETWVKRYRVYRKRAGEEGFSFIGDVITPTFRDNDALTSETEYYITACGPSLQSEPSAAIKVNPQKE